MVAKLLVTGGGGFVLSHAAKQWVERGPGYEVVIVDRNWDEDARNLFSSCPSDRVHIVLGDVCTDKLWTDLLISHPDIVAVAHGATITPTSEEEARHPERVVQVNIMGTVKALTFARKLRAPVRFVYVSSGAVYSEDSPLLSNEPLLEEGPTLPQELYSITKFTCEHIVRRYTELYPLQLQSTCVRFSDVYGEMDRDTGARNRHNLPYFLCRAKAAAGSGAVAVAVSGNIDEAGGDFVWVQDVARALVLLLSAAHAPRKPAYNIANGEWTSIRELFRAAAVRPLAQKAGVRAQVHGATGRHKFGRHGAYSIAALKEEYNWQPTPMGDAMRTYIAFESTRLEKSTDGKARL